jgi:hypothetical protein
MEYKIEPAVNRGKYGAAWDIADEGETVFYVYCYFARGWQWQGVARTREGAGAMIAAFRREDRRGI